MVGYRKLTLGLIFIFCCTFLIWQGIRANADLVGLSTVLGAMAAGVFGVIWGNVKEDRNK